MSEYTFEIELAEFGDWFWHYEVIVISISDMGFEYEYKSLNKLFVTRRGAEKYARKLRSNIDNYGSPEISRGPAKVVATF